MTATSADMAMLDLSTLLTTDGIDGTDIVTIENWLTAHLPASGLVPVEMVGDDSQFPGGVIPDLVSPDGYQPQLMDIDLSPAVAGNELVPILNADQFPALHDVIWNDEALNFGTVGSTVNYLDVTGGRSVDIYTSDLAGATAGDSFHLDLSGGTGDDTVVMGNDNGDSIIMGGYHGAAAGTYTLGNGNGDEVIWATTGLYEKNQAVTLGTGTGDYVDYGWAGNNDTITANGANAYIAPVSGSAAGASGLVISGGAGSHDTIIGGSGLNNTLKGSTGGFDHITEGNGQAQTAIAEGTGDVLMAGLGASDVLKSTFANTTFSDVDDNQASVNLIMKGGAAAGDVFNLGNGGLLGGLDSETANGTGVGDVFNIGMNGGTVAVNTNKLGTVNFADNWDNATVTKDLVSGWDVTFADTGAVDHITGVSHAMFAGILHTWA